jgi:hypothetical protein
VTEQAGHAYDVLSVRDQQTLISVIDRWIFVFMAALFVVTTLVGFVPDVIDETRPSRPVSVRPGRSLRTFHTELRASARQ